MARTRVKICGITRVEDALNAVALGADALGLVFCQSSPRQISLEAAKTIVDALPPFVTMVALFMDNSEAEINAVLAETNINLLQFHGMESAEFCEQFDFPYIKALPMLEAIDIEDYAKQYVSAKAYLLDAVGLGQAGGRGETFSWSAIPKGLAKPLILAGGLNANNVRGAILETHCYAVDVSSGVEQDKGIKDLHKMKEFIKQVKAADNEND